MGLYSEGPIIGGLFVNEILGAYIREGLFSGGGGGWEASNFTVYDLYIIAIHLISRCMCFQSLSHDQVALLGA